MPVNVESDAYGFNRELRKLNTLASCADLFRAAIAPFGFDTFACGEVDLSDRSRNAFYIIDWPDKWREFYVGSSMIDRDPIVDALPVRREPFTWSDLRRGRGLSRAGREALDIIAEHGWTEGLVVPLPLGPDRFGLVSLAGRCADLAPQARAYLTLISICLHGHARVLLPGDGFVVAPAGLTGREIECLGLVARGLSDRRIAATLGIAVSTAHEHVENAKRKLSARSRAETIAQAVSLGVVGVGGG